MTGIRLPEALNDDDIAVGYLTTYYAPRLDKSSGRTEIDYTEAFFDRFGEDDEDPNRLLPADLMAVYLHGGTGFGLRVAAELLHANAEEYAGMLKDIGEDTNLWKASKKQVKKALKFESKLKELPGVGPATAGKLVARKRPKLYPIGDRVVSEALGTRSGVIWPLREELKENKDLVKKLKGLRKSAGLPKTISPVRVLDVVTWMEQKSL
ncbi:hypothetical protein C3B44_03250 [Corynebacterium yudongzhengii]|uniref:Uncharacterized protein n=1 Tax=Corynebacterium yudongzhengii TaxID=2080740 RepID=A0A2U1T7G8_9CORY|nr:hypothetical protein C3B44_03250 [Corynebacterium yudongzhengii]PWC01939.1 hypothetical protein DF222_04995 [Corynebacterium yudongzhengii]